MLAPYSSKYQANFSQFFNPSKTRRSHEHAAPRHAICRPEARAMSMRPAVALTGVGDAVG